LFEPAETKKKLDMQGWSEVLKRLEEKNFTFQHRLYEVETVEDVNKGKLLQELGIPIRLIMLLFPIFILSTVLFCEYLISLKKKNFTLLKFNV